MGNSYYQENKEQIIKRSKIWAENNPEKRREICRRYYWKNREKERKEKKINCPGCNVEIEKTGNPQRYCKICSEKRHKESKRRYYERNKDVLNKKSKEVYKKNKRYYQEYNREWQKKNREKINGHQRLRYKLNPEKYKLAQKKYRNTKEGKEKILERHGSEKYQRYFKNYRSLETVKKKKRERHKDRYRTNKEFKICNNLRGSLYKALRKYTKTGKIMSSKKYGVDYKAIIEHLKPFPEDLNKYHVDHIKPLFAFNFVNSDGSQNLEAIKEAFAPKNLQWLKAKENLKKGIKEI